MIESSCIRLTGLVQPITEVSRRLLATADPSIFSVPLIVESAGSTPAQQPVTVGVPFPRGVLTDGVFLSLVDPSNRPALLQLCPLARWSDGSVKWMLLDFILGSVDVGQSVWSLEMRHGKPPESIRPEDPLRVQETDRAIVVHTGSATFTLDRDILAPLAQVEIENMLVLDRERTRTILVDAKGRNRRPHIERCELEADGPVRATVRFEGTFEGTRRKRCRFQARLSFFSGLSLARIELTLHNPRRARHRGGLWDLGDWGSVFLRDLSIQLALAGAGARRVQWTENGNDHIKSAECNRFEIYQDSSGGENWQSRNHVNRLGQITTRFRGYRTWNDGIESYSLRASPVVSLSGDKPCITVGMPQFWQEFPKAIDVDHGRLSIRLFPLQSGWLYELQGGEQKTHTVWLHFGSQKSVGIDSVSWVHRPARVHCSPAWYADSEAIPHFLPASVDRDDRFEIYVSAAIDVPQDLQSRRETVDEYGWRHYGEIYADHENEYYIGQRPLISHYNNQYDLVLGTLVQYLRSSDSRWFELCDPLARHVIDIDVYHTTRDKAAYNGGLFWHTDHYCDAATCTHRGYSRANRGSLGRLYGGGPCNEHNYTTGLLHYYYLTGDPQARDAVVGLADYVINMDDGSKNVLGLIDDGPTGSASATSQIDYHGPGRGCGNSINALLDAWLLLGNRRYLGKAEVLIRRAIHPNTEIDSLDLLNVELRWSYTVFLSVLARYLSLKAEKEELDSMYAYARASLLAFTSWMVNHEVPYFDHAEKLEYPTETWPAQEMRKANVLRLAAQHADEPLRSKLIERAGAFAERAWSDLMRFDSRHTTRALAILLVEGMRDSYWKAQAIRQAPKAIGEFDFGAPQAFIPQKQRVMNQLKTPGGAVRASMRLASVWRWWRFLSWRGLNRD